MRFNASWPATGQPAQSPTWAAQQVPPGAELARSEPARAADLVADLLVPIGQAMVTGAVLAGVITFAVARLGYDGDLLTWWAGWALGIGALTWVLLLLDTRRLLWALERLTGLDLDRDGATGNPAKQTLEVEVKDGRTRRYIGADWLGIDDDRLILFAAGMVRGRGLAEGEWGKDKAAFPQGINQWRAFRAKLAEAGLIALVNLEAPNLGYAVTPAGRAVFKRLAECSHTHTHERGP